MEWFKHKTNTNQNYKIRKLLKRFGANGYAVYFHCLELIAGTFDSKNITFELKHDAEIIADNLYIKSTQDRSATDIVNDILSYLIEEDFFQVNDNRVFCFKMIEHFDSSMTSNPKMRKLIQDAKENQDTISNHHDDIMILSCKNRREENRREENRIEEDSSTQTICEHDDFIVFEYNNCKAGSKSKDTLFSLNRVELEEYQALFKDIDVMEQLGRMKMWLDAKPERRKTKSGMKKAILVWLTNAVDFQKSKINRFSSNEEKKEVEHVMVDGKKMTLDEYAKMRGF